MDLDEEEEYTQPLLTIVRALTFKIEIEDNTICNFISEPTYFNRQAYQILNNTLKNKNKNNFQKKP